MFLTLKVIENQGNPVKSEAIQVKVMFVKIATYLQ